MFIFVLMVLFATADSLNIGRQDQKSVNDAILKINKASGLMERGDLAFGDTKKEGKMRRSRRHAVADQTLLWESGVVPYEIEDSLSFMTNFSVKFAMNVLKSKTCIRFKQREESDAHFVKFTSGTGCWSYIGRRILPGINYQELTLGENCVTKGIALHEIMHLLGFYHEHSRADRNDYINVLWDNIDPANAKYFLPVDRSSSTFDHGSYDYESIMHYNNMAFSMNGKPTMEAKDDPKRSLGGKESLSDKDIQKIKKLYHCQAKRTVGVWGDWSSWGECMGNGLRKRLRKCMEDDVTLCPNAYYEGFQFDKKSC